MGIITAQLFEVSYLHILKKGWQGKEQIKQRGEGRRASTKYTYRRNFS